MEDLMKSLPKEAQKAIEEVPVIQEIIEPEPQGGFPWCGVGIGVGVVVLAAIFAKLYKCTAKK